MDKKIDISIIIISFNTKELLNNCIRSVRESTANLTSEIIVVDNNSTDGSAEMVLSEFQNIILIRNYENRGFAKANNQAMNIAKGKYLLLINSDAILRECTTSKLLTFMNEHPRAAAVGPKILNEDMTLQSKGFLFPSIPHALIGLFRISKYFSDSLLYLYLPKYYWNENETRMVEWISGSCMLLRSEVVQIIGGLSEDFFMYYEDEEWCYRASKAGYQIWYYPLASVIHKNNASPMEGRDELVENNSSVFFKKTVGIRNAFFILLIHALSNIVSMFSALLFQPSDLKRYIHRFRLNLHFIRLLFKS